METFYIIPAVSLLIGGVLYYVIEQNGKTQFLSSKSFNLICLGAIFFNAFGSILCFIALVHG